MRVVLIGAARPNFMKVAPVLRSLEAGGLDVVLVHTGQHYDDAMSGQFFRELGIRRPEVNLSVGAGTHGYQIGGVMRAFEPVLKREAPDAVVVVGDVNSTFACSLVSAQAGVPVAHVEAGLRSGDRRMPEEINRLCTDVLADWLFTPSKDADDNLRAEGVAPARIFRVGNVMIDTLLRVVGQHPSKPLPLGVDRGSFVLATLHRPATVDDPVKLREVVDLLNRIAARERVVFPAHPRTAARIDDEHLKFRTGVRLVPPLGYSDFVRLMSAASVVITDSGGVQEETTVLGVPCLTFRETTERPVTVTEGTNTVVGTDARRAYEAYVGVSRDRRPHRPELWDGRAADRITEILLTVPPPLAAARSDSV